MVKLIIVKSTGNIPVLNVGGPIRSPFQMKSEQIIELIKRGVDVYEVTPDQKVELKLTRANFHIDNHLGEKAAKRVVKTPTVSSPLQSAVSGSAVGGSMVVPVITTTSEEAE